jgi:hypothetical protein
MHVYIATIRIQQYTDNTTKNSATIRTQHRIPSISQLEYDERKRQINIKHYIFIRL